MADVREFKKSYEKIIEKYLTAVDHLDAGMKNEEKGSLVAAKESYEKSLNDMNDILKLPIELPLDFELVQTEWQDIVRIIKNVKAARMEVQYRMGLLERKMEAKTPVENKQVVEEEPELEEAVEADEMDNGQPSPKKVKKAPEAATYNTVVKGLREVIADKTAAVSFKTLFTGRVRLFVIRKNIVYTLAEETPMSLVECGTHGSYGYLNGVRFLQCSMPSEGSDSTNRVQLIWIYPLIAGRTSCYLTDDAFIFPDLESLDPKTAFALALVKENDVETNDDVITQEEFFIDLLEAILKGPITDLRGLDKRTKSASQVVSRGFIVVADHVSSALVKTAEKTGELLGRARPHLLSTMSPAGSEPVEVPSSLRTSVEVAQSVTKVAAGVTGWVAGKIGSASMAVGSYLAPHIHHHGANLLERSFGYSKKEANSKMEGAFTIAAGCVEGCCTIFDGLETSARILGESVKENSVKIIEYKYGQPAGDVAAGTLESVGNAFTVSQNVNYITPRGFAKKMAKTTGKAVVDDYQKTLRNDNRVVLAENIPEFSFENPRPALK